MRILPYSVSLNDFPTGPIVYERPAHGVGNGTSSKRDIPFRDSPNLDRKETCARRHDTRLGIEDYIVVVS
ncbi:MAG: hypothetical protein AABW89_06135 [Nanoarchaeota archaeon]